jgi:hypothetical protein
MSTRRVWLPITLLLAWGGCRDAATPPTAPAVAGPTFDNVVFDGSHLLLEAKQAPPLETYQVSFWASSDRASSVVVRYKPVAGQTTGDPFLQFDIPLKGLLGGAGGVPLLKSDSILITITIDPVTLRANFQPAGALFSKKLPAKLAIWYENADPDYNQDGKVDSTDDLIRQNLGIWYQSVQSAPWYKQWSANDPSQLYVLAPIYHFSSYAVSW